MRFELYSKALGTLKLVHAPIGWDDTQYTFERHSTYIGVFQEFSAQLEFVKEGYDYINRIYEQQGIEGEILLNVFREDPNNFEYKRYFNGRLDLTKRVKTSTAIKVNILRAGVTQKLINRDNISLNIQSLKTLSGNIIEPYSKESHMVNLHSKTIKKVTDVSTAEDATTGSIFIPGLSEVFVYAHPGFTDVTFQEIEEFIDYGVHLSPLNPIENEKWMYNIQEGGSYLFDIQIIAEWTSTGNLRGTYEWILQIGDEEHFLGTVSNLQAHNSIQFNAKIKFLYPVNAGTRIYLYARASVLAANSTQTLTLSPESYLKVTASTNTPESTGEGLPIYEILDRSITQMTDKPGILKSSLYGRTDSEPVQYDEDGEAALRLVLGGLNIRGFSLEDRTLNLKFQDLFDSLEAIDNIGIGIELDSMGNELVVIEKKEYFFNHDVIFEIEDAELEESVAEEHYFNQSVIGYQKFENEEVNGLDEFNTQIEHSLPISVVKKNYNQVSKIRADGYGIEFARRIGPTTEDSNYDRDVFFVCVQRDGEDFKSETNEPFEFIKNVLSPETIYNARISPARNLRRHGKALKMMYLKNTDGELSFIRGEHNSEMESKLIGEETAIRENMDIESRNLPDPLFIPEIYSFEAPITMDQIDLIKANPYGVIKFGDKSGHILSIKAKEEGIAEYELLREYKVNLQS